MPSNVADVMEQWFIEGAADGFNILPAKSRRDMWTFADLIVPELQRRSLFHTAYEARVKLHRLYPAVWLTRGTSNHPTARAERHAALSATSAPACANASTRPTATGTGLACSSGPRASSTT